MSENLTIYEKAVTTDRPAEILAKCHGFESVEQLAEFLPAGAHVLDVGAGASPFGKEVAILRPDINWVNFDYSYQDPLILDEVTQNSPTNLEHIAGDATKLAEIFKQGTFDAVFSYWLLPHLSLDGPEPAKQATEGIFSVTKPGGLISIGPNSSKKKLLSLKASSAVQVVKDEALSSEKFVELIVNETKLPKVTQHIQRIANEVATPFFGTTRYAKRDGRVPKLYHPDSGEFVSPFTRKGASTVGHLAVAMVRYSSSQRKAKKQLLKHISKI